MGIVYGSVIINLGACEADIIIYKALGMLDPGTILRDGGLSLPRKVPRCSA